MVFTVRDDQHRRWTGKYRGYLCVQSKHQQFLFSSRDKYRFYACLLRARFDENKHEKDLVKATLMLKAGEEEFWSSQHPQPYLFPDSPGGTSYERYECYKVGDRADASLRALQGLLCRGMCAGLITSARLMSWKYSSFRNPRLQCTCVE